MRLRSALFLLPLLLWTACIRSTDVVKKKYLDNGNKYFAAKKYREASIMYKNAIKKDQKYGEAYYRLALCDLELRSFTTAGWLATRSRCTSGGRIVRSLSKTSPTCTWSTAQMRTSDAIDGITRPLSICERNPEVTPLPAARLRTPMPRS